MRDRLLGVVAPAAVGVAVVALGSAAAAEVGPFGGSNDGDEVGLVRVEPPQLVGHGQTSDGSNTSVRHSRATNGLRPQGPLTCVSVERSATSRGDENGQPSSGEVCGPAPQEGRLTFAVDTVLSDSSTGAPAELHHFVSGFTKGDATKVLIEDTSGHSAELEVSAVENGSTKVFWGSIPPTFHDGDVSIQALRADGTAVAEGTLRIGDAPPGVPPLR